MKFIILVLTLFVQAIVIGQVNNNEGLEKLMKDGYESLSSGDIDVAGRIFDNIIQIDSMYYKAYNAKAIGYEYLGKFDSALLYVNKAIAIKEDYDQGYVVKGDIMVRKNDLKQAYKFYETALKINPQNPDAVNGIASVYFFEGNINKAKRNYERSLKMEPDNPSVYYNLGTIYIHKQNYSKAIKCFDKALEINPTAMTVNISMVYANRGTAKYYLNDLGGALLDYKKSLQLNPDNPTVLVNIGMIYVKQHGYKESIEYFDKALQIDPKSKSAYFNRGLVYYKYLYNSEKALQDFQQSLILGYDDAYPMIKRIKNELSKENHH